jgi:hypothetical protein
MNMSYCQFQNTLLDLHQCKETLECMMDADSETLSKDETRAAKNLVAMCADIVRSLNDYMGLNCDESRSCDDAEKIADNDYYKSAIEFMNEECARDDPSNSGSR